MAVRRRQQRLRCRGERAARTEVHEQQPIAGPRGPVGVEEADDERLGREDRGIRTGPLLRGAPDRGGLAAQAEQVAVQREERTAAIGLPFTVVEPGLGERPRVGGIGDASLCLARRVARELGQEAAPAGVHVGGQLARVVGEEPERRRRPELLAHEQHRRARREQHERGQRAHEPRGREFGHALARERVRDLVVVLEERDERRRRQVERRRATPRPPATGSSGPGTGTRAAPPRRTPSPTPR